jgi:type III pantothenate kinase
MTKILALDIGNTRTKYAEVNNGEVDEIKYLPSNEINHLFKTKAQHRYDGIICSSVVTLPADINNLGNNSNTPLIQLAHTCKLPFVLNYSTPHTLGTDRLALVAGAAATYPMQDTLVIACGTCITYNFINANNGFEGGAISPGLVMRYKALNTFTSKLPMLEYPHTTIGIIGNSTEQSIHSGVFNGILAELDGTIESYKLKYPQINVVLTGGDHPYFAHHIKNKIFADEKILFKGLYGIALLNI